MVDELNKICCIFYEDVLKRSTYISSHVHVIMEIVDLSVCGDRKQMYCGLST